MRVAVPMRGFALREPSIIYVQQSGYFPRDEFTRAHEVMELFAPPDIRAASSESKERFCDKGAAALLLPRRQFLFSLHATGWDLPKLKRRWPWSSWATIASRLHDLVPGVSASSWVENRREWGRYPEGAGVPALVALRSAEEDAVLELYRGRGVAVARRSSTLARAWRLTARGKRVAIAVCKRD